MADYKTPQWLLPNEKNLAYPATGAETGSGLSEDRHSLYSMDFDGTNYIDLNDNNIINGFTSVSFSFWVNVTTPGLYDGILCSRNGSDYILIFLDNVSGSDFKIKIQQNSTSGGSATITTSPTLTSGNWYNVVCTGIVGGKWDLYINGDNTGQTQGANNITAITQSSNFLLGSDTLLAGRYLNGLSDEVAIWNKALNQSEINALSVADAPANIMALNEKPIAYYPLGEQAQMGSANWSFPNGSLQSHAVSFDGSTDYISAGSLSYVTSNVFTISGWIKATTSPPTYMPLFNFQNSSGIGSKFNWGHGSAPILWYSGSTYKFFANGAWRTDGLWHNVLLVIDRTTIGNSKLYVDGDEISGGTTSGSGSMVLNNLNLGYTPTTQFYDGEMSNVAIWNSDQTANKDNIYNNGSPQSTYTATPTAWWKLNAANSSYVYPWSLELNGDPDVSGGGDHAKVVSNALEIRDIDSSGASTGTGGKVDFLTKEITGAYSGIDVTGEFVINTASSYTNGATLYYKIDGGSWVQFQQQLDTSGTTTYAISGASGLTSTTSFQVKIEFETGNSGNSTVTLNNISIGDLYTEDFTNQDGAGWDNDTYTPPPVDWTFIDTETPAPNYTSALSFDGTDDRIGFTSSIDLGTTNTISLWLRNEVSQDRIFLGEDSYSGDYHILGGYNHFIVRVGGSYNVLSTGSVPIIPIVSNWSHVVFIRNGDDVSLYINGYLSASSNTWTGGSPGSNVSKFDSIGAKPTGGTSWLGKISNVSTFNSELSAAQVQTLYNSGTPETDISFSPVSWWKLDNTTTGIEDSVGSNDGTNNGATQIATNVLISNNGESDTLPTSALTPSDLQFESPYSNYSLSFDGADDYVNFGNSSLLNFGNGTSDSPFSLSVWFYRPSSPANNSARILTKDDEWELRIAGSSSNSLYLQLNDSTAYRRRSGTFAGTGWHHIAATYSGSGDTTDYGIKIYVDGVRIDDTNLSSGTYVAMNNESGDTNLARLPNGTGYTAGKFDELAVFNSNLTQTQVNQVYNNGYPADLTSLSPICWWRLGEDAFFVSNVVTIPNKITGGPSGTGGGGDQSAFLVGDAPGSYANGSGTNLVVTDRIGDAPESTANSVSINMIPSNRISYPAGYVPTQVDNVYSMAFDGVSDYVDIGTISSVNSASACTISYWGKKASASGDDMTVGSSVSSTNGIWLQWYTDNNIYFSCRNGSSNFVSVALTGDTNWHHLVGVYDGTNTTIFIDGTQAATSSGSVPASLSATAGDNFQIGALNGSFFTSGNIDEVAIFDYALSARQIKQDIYEGTTAGGKTADLNNISNLTAPVAWYRMGD